MSCPSARQKTCACAAPPFAAKFGLGVGLAWQRLNLPDGRTIASRAAVPRLDVPAGVTARPLSKPQINKLPRPLRPTAADTIKTDQVRAWHDRQKSSKPLLIKTARERQQTEPLHLDWQGNEPRRADQLLLWVTADSRLTVVERVRGNRNLKLRTNSIRAYVEPGGHLTHIRIQDLPEKTTEFVWRDSTLRADSRLDWVECCFGASTMDRSETRLAGQGSQATVRRLVFADGQRQYAADDQLQHLADHTVSDVVFRAAATDEAHLINRAHAEVPPQLTGCQINEKSDTIMLSPRAWAASLPELSVGTGQVTGQHAAATGRLDRERLFYLQAHGLSEQLASQMLVNGFFAPIVAEMRAAGLEEEVEGLITDRLAK